MQGTDFVAELELLFTLLARTDSSVDDGPSLTSTQRVALIELVSSGPLRLGALAERIGVSDPTASRAVDGLVASAVVERRADPDDRRAVLHVATDKGRDWVERRRGEVAAALDRAIDGFGAADRKRLLELIGALNDRLGSTDDARPLRNASLLATG
ncbi:MAG TPA: MarR family transcriptional regulator [Gaiellaceae bacterium]|nr:MarR family transcriptional regulator [Gaiellaceae bacterium]